MLDDENPEGERGRIGPLGEENIEETPPGIPQNKPLREGPGGEIERTGGEGPPDQPPAATSAQPERARQPAG
jgi:hypothetical protein